MPRKSVKFEFVHGLDPWERQRGETDASWPAFCLYRDLGGARTYDAVNRALGKPKSSIASLYEWSTKFQWVDRVAEYDRERDRQELKARFEAQRNASVEMVERHLKISTSMQRIASVELMRLLRRLGADEQSPDMNIHNTLSPKEIRDLVDYSIKLERLNRGEPESIQEQRHSLDSNEKRNTLNRALEKMDKGLVDSLLDSMRKDKEA